MVGTILEPSGGGLRGGQSQPTHSNFGGNRAYTPNKPRREGDYLKETLGAPDCVQNPVDETTRDVDDMSDPKDGTTRAKKREFQRRYETSTHGDYDATKDTHLNKEHFHVSDLENAPEEDTDVTKGDADNRRGTALKPHFGDGVAQDERKREGEIY